MRPAVLIAGANLAAFLLGGVATLWLVVATGSGERSSPTAETAHAAPAPAAALPAKPPPPTPAPPPVVVATTAAPAAAAASPAPPPAAPAPPPAASPPAAAAVAPPPAAPPAATAAPAAAPANTQPAPAPPSPPPAAQAAAAPGAPDAAPPAASAPPRPPVAAAPPAPRGRYVLQLAAFREPANAERMLAAVVARGFPARIVPTAPGGGGWNLVQVGSYPDRPAAAAAAAELRGRTGLSALILRAPSS